MKIILFCGFLGAGKTSLLLPFARYLVEACEDRAEEGGKTKLAIIENEVGQTGIDDKLLKKAGLLVKELFTGCICCTLTSDLTLLLNNLAAEYNPRWVIIEATGIAYPQNIINTVSRYGQGIDQLKVVGISDAERWEELYTMMTGLIEGQLSTADLILINKRDLVDSAVMTKVKQEVRLINSAAPVFEVSAMEGVEPERWDQIIAL